MSTRSLLTALTLTATLGFAIGCGDGTTTDDAASSAEGESKSLIQQGGDAAKAAGDLAASLGMEPKDAIAKVESLLGENKITEAKELFDKLVAMKDQLPADLQAKVTELAGKFTGGNVPALPGGLGG
ncbi:MAG: hypothetical protein AAF750_08515 [Planctomycetota bacterium]